ncbi:helix-turn-helix domain-containing protein [Cohnella sp. JJ-181]|uniref:helix-turn-helix domain-containing protein n=1 Tax=Cohnella rhizoplanae TaxID=2974897 RepID=UPI0022FF7D16|nr:helix-turn-helix domain-containing protein [Cohnella sp. JJ-181]CAI6070328.1 HTH-type transcriptional activator RhaR [Cohnella sp. JJ-181]
MRVVIVDDERHVREAVRLLVDWRAIGVGEIHEAANGEEAAALIERVRPGIVVTDMMMPIQGGLDLLAWLQAHRPEIQKIVISGHDDFHLVRGTMQHGGQDYLLKPIDPEQLTSALERAVARWNEQDQSRKQELARSMEINQLRPVMRDRIFSDLLGGGDSYGNARSALQGEPVFRTATSCLVAVLDLESASSEVTERYAGNRDLLFFTLTNIADEVLQRGDRGLACRNLRSENEILLFFWTSPGAARPDAEAQRLLSEINACCLLTLKCRFDFGIGTVQPFPKGAAHSYRAAQAALRERDLLAERAHYYPSEAAAIHAAGPAPRLDDYEESLRLAVLSGSDKQIRDAVGRCMTELRRMPRISSEQLDRWRTAFEEMLQRWQEAGDSRSAPSAAGWTDTAAPAPTGVLPLDDRGRLDLNGLETVLRDFLIAWSRSRPSAGQSSLSAIPAVVRYIEQHYNQELTLQEIANQFYLSREYISRRFKQETGENMIDFLTRIRIDKAKLLLANPNFKIAQVAEMVGYQDEKYFSKVFKKLTGVSPNQYRKKSP